MAGGGKQESDRPTANKPPVRLGRAKQHITFSSTPRRRPGRRRLAVFLLLLAVGAGLVYARVQRDATPIYESAADVPPMPVAVVFGAQGDVLQDRVQAGADLYTTGKVKKLLMTGDNHRAGYDEPAQMKQMALADGVPARALVCDDAGLRTYDSLYRARDIFGVRRAVLVTQRYHLPRALYLGRQMGLEVVGLDAARHDYAGQAWFDLREFFAIEAAWLDIQTHRRPKFLGKKEPIFPQGA